MAKRARVKTELDEELAHGGSTAHSDRRDEVQTAAIKHLMTQFKDARICTPEESMFLCGGIALPSLGLRYVLGQDAMPLGRIITYGGAFGSCKTSFAVETSRWFLYYNGLGWYCDAELRDSPDMRKAILRHDGKIMNYLRHIKCPTQQAWQGAVTFSVDQVSKMCPDRWDIPSIAIVDSVAAVKPAEDQTKFMKEKAGAGSRGYASVALLNSDWLANIAPRVSAGPFCLALIQHSTEKQVDGAMPGVTAITHKGGGEIGYLKSISFELTRTKHLRESNTEGGLEIKIKVLKNSLGVSQHQLFVRVKWWWEDDPESGGIRQQYLWDWHDAAIHLLLSFATMKGRATTWKRINEVVDLHEMSKRRVWSRALGIPKDSPVSYTEAGEILEYDHPELLPELYKVLHIFRRPILKPGDCLKELWDGKMEIPAVPAVIPYPRGGTWGLGGGDDDDE